MTPSQSPPVFLSSCFDDPERHRLCIRDRIQAITGGPASLLDGKQRPVWMAEDYPELRPESPWPAFEKAQFCLDGVRAAECFVAVITTRHGSPVPIEGAGIVPSSFFEAELFEAALLEKPSFIFLLEGYEPDAKLANLLKLLAPFFPNMSLRPAPEDEILKRIEKLVRNHQRPRWLRPLLAPPQLRPTVNALFHARHRSYAITEAPPFRFLGGAFDAALSPPDPAVVESVLNHAATSQQHHVRLTLLWFAIRALMGAPFSDPMYRDMLQFWVRAFDAWVTAGAWYGLHGHVDLGCLAALGSLADVRSRLAETSDPSHGIPHGPLASEYYSIARLAGQSGEILALSLNHIEAALHITQGDGVNETAIRASIYREMGRADAALGDYSKVAEARRERGGAAYGEALSELGYAMLLLGKAKRGLSMMEQGLDLLRTAPPSGFRIRAMRKLAIGYAHRGKFLAALDIAIEAHDLALAIGAHDQIRRLERLAKHFDSVRFWRH